jgi:hypothetical protein
MKQEKRGDQIEVGPEDSFRPYEQKPPEKDRQNNPTDDNERGEAIVHLLFLGYPKVPKQEHPRKRRDREDDV